MNKVVTFGCRLNTYESSAIKDLADQAGLKDTIVINTCAVTNEAERQARQSIRKLKKENPNSSIIVTGCAAQIKPETFSKMQEVDFIIGNNEKMQIDSYKNLNERVLVNDIFSVRETASHLVSGFEGKVRAFIQVQNGCNHRCTFCTIPYGRGNSRSVPINEIINQAKHLVDLGYVEFVVTGVDLTSYGEDLDDKPSFSFMIKELLEQVPSIKRLRISSIDVIEVDELFFEVISDRRVMPHLHLSLQSGDNLILKRMKRRHLRDDAIAFCEKARRFVKDIVFGADLIVGFPTETDEHFENTLRLIDECNLSLIHFFSYSSKEGTPAARMPQVKHSIIKERVKMISAKSKEVLLKTLGSFHGKEVTVLMETKEKGKTDHFLQVQTLKNQKEGEIVKLQVKNFDEKSLICTD